jgi:hypothetical protein
MTAYAGTKSQTGKGTILSQALLVVGEVTSIALSGRKQNFEDATNMQSTFEEVISTIPSPGEWDVELNRVSLDPGQAAMEAAITSGNLLPFTVTFPKAPGQITTGDVYAFNAYVESFDFKAAPKTKVSATLKLKVTNSITFTPGA